MIVSSPHYRRLLIPRWRSFAKSLLSSEMAHPATIGTRSNQSGYSNELLKRLARWRSCKDLITAAELVEAALVLGEEASAIEAAHALLGPKSDATVLVRRQAILLINRVASPESVWRKPAVNVDAEVAFWRDRTRNHREDPLAWSELALARLIQGRVEASIRNIQIALHLAPQSRYILRAAARLFCHNHERERAHELIRWNEATPRDPWLMAAEISLAQLVDRKPVFVKKGLDFIEHKRALPRQITELAGAIGTFYLKGGFERRSKKLFGVSLADPTANSLAQAEWASWHSNNNLISETTWNRAGFANEALATHAARQGQFEIALERCIEWIAEERFSSRAFVAASSTANVLDDYVRAEAFAKEGLRYNPRSSSLRNSLAFSLASRGKLDDAEVELRKIANLADDQDGKLISDANNGLIAMRRGNLALGESLYRQAISRFRQANKHETAATAHAYFARESVKARHPLAAEILAEAKRWTSDRNFPVTRRVLVHTESLLKRDPLTS